MKPVKLGRSFRKIAALGTVGLFAASMVVWAQEPPTNPPESQTQVQTPSTPGQDKPRDPASPTAPTAPPVQPTQVEPPAPPDQPPGPPPPAPAPEQPSAPEPATPGWHKFSPQPEPAAPTAQPGPAPKAMPAPVPVPPQITLPAGTFVTIRVDQYLSSDKNKAGDAFSATLARPLVANGLIIAPAGATVGGHVVEAKKAGRVSGVSHLQVALNTLTLADGQQVPVESALTSINGNTSNGRDAGAIVATTATGAAIGAAADWGTGAAIGGGAGLAAGVVGVLLTRGRPTIIYPESRLTFRLAKPVTFSTAKAPQAFADARILNVQRASAQQNPPSLRYRGPGGPYYPPPGPYYYYPYYWGPSFGLVFGGGYGRGYYGYRYGYRR